MAEMLELAPKDFDAAIIIILKEIRDNVLTMNEKKKNRKFQLRNRNYKKI